MKAFIYRNLHKDCWSIKSRQPGVHYGRVVAHAKGVLVSQAKFSVSEPGRQRVIESGHKNVHAGVVGNVVGLIDSELLYPVDLGIDGPLYPERVLSALITTNRPIITYDPYKAGYFFIKENGKSVYDASTVGMYSDMTVRALISR